MNYQPTKYKTLALLLFSLIVVLSCNPARRLERQQANYQKIVDDYNRTHPVKIDTTTHFLPGENIYIETEKTDTVIKKGKTDTVIINNNFYHNDTRRDTLIKIITNSDQERLLQNKIVDQGQQIAALQAIQTNNKKYWWWIIGEAIAIIILTSILLKKFL